MDRQQPQALAHSLRLLSLVVEQLKLLDSASKIKQHHLEVHYSELQLNNKHHCLEVELNSQGQAFLGSRLLNQLLDLELQVRILVLV